MNKEEFKKVIRKLVREEAKTIIAEEIQKAMGKVLVEMVKEIKSTNNSSTMIDEEIHPSTTIIKTKNPKLNSALEETVRNSKSLIPQRDSSSLVQLMEDFEKVGGDEEIITENKEPKTNIDFLKQMCPKVSSSGGSEVDKYRSELQNQPSILDGEVPDLLKNILKKSKSVMKKLDQK